MRIKIIFGLVLMSAFFYSCDVKDETDSEDSGPRLIVKFQFDPNQVRLNNLGEPSTVLPGNAAQSPVFNKISSHYLEFAPNEHTALGAGEILYRAPEVNLSGVRAIDFSKAKIVSEGEVFLSIPLKDIPVGSYEWVRCSLSYQDYNINVLSGGTDYVGSLASFVGFKTYLTTHNFAGTAFPVNAIKNQGYWEFVIQNPAYSTSGQAPEGATTVPNPLHATSAIPANSCVVTGKFANNFVVTGHETQDVVVTLSLSINNSFEWQEVTADGKYEPSIGENVVDMGLRGLIPRHQ
jgi:hypothetical protein